MSANPSQVQDYFEPQRFLAHVLRQRGVDLFDGLTDTTSRAQAAQAAIIAHGLAAVVIGRYAGKPETYSAYFARAFGQPLEPKP